MNLRKSDLIEIIKDNINDFSELANPQNTALTYDNLDDYAEAVADKIFEKLKNDLFIFSERATDGDAIALSNEIDNYLIEY